MVERPEHDLYIGLTLVGLVEAQRGHFTPRLGIKRENCFRTLEN